MSGVHSNEVDWGGETGGVEIRTLHEASGDSSDGATTRKFGSIVNSGRCATRIARAGVAGRVAEHKAPITRVWRLVRFLSRSWPVASHHSCTLK